MPIVGRNLVARETRLSVGASGYPCAVRLDGFGASEEEERFVR